MVERRKKKIPRVLLYKDIRFQSFTLMEIIILQKSRKWKHKLEKDTTEKLFKMFDIGI
jgi:hypothetical protein